MKLTQLYPALLFVLQLACASAVQAALAPDIHDPDMNAEPQYRWLIASSENDQGKASEEEEEEPDCE